MGTDGADLAQKESHLGLFPLQWDKGLTKNLRLASVRAEKYGTRRGPAKYVPKVMEIRGFGPQQNVDVH